MSGQQSQFPRRIDFFFWMRYQTDFRNWNAGFPFDQKVNAVLANFAVINCIPDIELLFEKLALAWSRAE